MAPVLEFLGGQREPVPIDRRELYIGRAANCAVRLEATSAEEQHARLTVDAAGNVYIQDLDTMAGTLRNGNFVYGVQQLAEGDKIEIGGMALVFRATAPAVDVAPPSAMRASADERTRMPTELPPEVKAVLAARQAQAAQPAPKPQPAPPPSTATARAAAPPPPVEAAPAGIIVGTPEPEPDNFRTVQMAPADLAALGIDPASLPPINKPELPKRTVMGMPPPIVPKTGAPLQPPAPSSLGSAATMELKAQPAPSPPARPVQQTLMGAPRPLAPRPVVSPTAPTPPAPQPAPRPVVAAPAPPMKTAPLMEAPVVAPPPIPVAAPPIPVAAPPPVAAPYQPAAAAPMAAAEYTPPPRGSFGPFSRALAFMGQIFSLAGQHKALLKPLVYDVLLTTPIMAAFTVLEFFVHSRNGFYAVMGVEAFLLYFVDYACNAITASLIYDYSTTGEATMASALPRVKKALPGVLTFAAVSALLDVASTYARERNDIVSRIVLRVLRAIWTTATYVIMPALVIEGVSFGDAFKRSKALMDEDPTGVGAGIVAMSITSYIVAAVCFPLSYVVMRALGHIHPAIGALGAMLIVNLYWSVSGWMKIAYSTCFYMWARECERTHTPDRALAPLPLRTALDAG
jgi:pSer/pThr/pTyr-binding forkhead associated (FHA) protein